MSSDIVLSILMIAYFMFKGDYAFSGVLFIFLFAIVLYYRKIYNKLAAIQPTADVHVYLVDVHRELKDFVRKYQVSLSILFAIAFALALYIRSKEIPIEDKMQEPMFIVKLICMYIISLALAFFVVHLVYGQKIKKIREMLDEMEK